MKENEEKKENEKINKEKNTEKDKESSSSKELSQFISIIEQASTSLPNLLNSIKKYFSCIESKITFLKKQLNHNFNINNEIISINKEENFFSNEDIFFSLEQSNQISKYIDIFNSYQKFLEEKNKKLIDYICESIINEVKKRMEKYKLEKNKIFYKFQNLINDVLKLKKYID